MALLIGVILAVAIILLINYVDKQKKAVQKPVEPHFDTIVEELEYRNNRGTLALNSDGSISLLNGNKPCVTLIGASRQIANEIISICDDMDSLYESEKKVCQILMENGIQVKEVEVFRSRVCPIVEKKVRELIEKDEEWESLGERDKEDKYEEYVNISMEELWEDVSPAMFGALSVLAFKKPVQVPLLNEMIIEYGVANIDTYFQYRDRKNPIIKIADANYRKPLENLVKAGLAYTGKDMSIEELLSTLTLAELNELASTDTKFTRKDKVINYLAEKEDISSIIDKNITLRALFSLCPLPDKFKEFDFEEYAETKEYYENLADVLVSLYKGYSSIPYK